MKIFLRSLLSLPFLFFALQAQATVDYFHQVLDPSQVQEILQTFPEGQVLSPTLLDFKIDPNLHLFQEAAVLVTFWSEGAAFENEFGYFLYEDSNHDGEIQLEEIAERHRIFERVSWESEGGTMNTGDSARLGKFAAGTRMGFYLTTPGPDGPRWTFYTLDQLNFDAHRHLAMLASADKKRIVLGIEDLPWEGSDRDFNDILFTVTTDPPKALEEVIDSGHIPTQSAATPSPLPEIAKPQVNENKIATPSEPVGPNLYLEGSGRGCSFDASQAASHWQVYFFLLPSLCVWLFVRLTGRDE